MDLAQCTIPTRHGTANCYAFKSANGEEHLALVWRNDPAQIPLVRIHSECLTGDVLGSLRCDCGDQLNLALESLSVADHAVLIYLKGHEGRGIGLFNKIRAYERQQDFGEDTVDANVNLGLPIDARSYEQAAEFLRCIGIERISLLTNNPNKLAAMSGLGIQIEKRVPLVAPPRPDSQRYVATKVARLGHLIEEWE